MDATGSMQNLLQAAKDTVSTMFKRASEVLNEMKLPAYCFQMQFVVYRDYDCNEDGLLECSPWESKPENLHTFLAKVRAYGGDDYEEAIEVGLQYANEECNKNGLSQLILIGDAPAKDREAIKKSRSTKGTSYWDKTRYKEETYYADEIKKLKNKNVQVHSFYIHDGARENFEKISRETNGICEKLDICSLGGAEKLTNLITERILEKSAGDMGKDAVKLYRSKFSFT